MDRWYYTAEQIAKIVKFDSQYIRILAGKCPEKLPFKTEIRYVVDKKNKKIISSKYYTRIPRAPFREWYLAQGGDPEHLDSLDAS